MDKPGTKVDKPMYGTEPPKCGYCNAIIIDPTPTSKFCRNKGKCREAYHTEDRIKGHEVRGSKGMHFARLSGSPRLQRLLRFLSDERLHTTLEIIVGAKICAVNAAVPELRQNGFNISCNLREILEDGSKIFEYQLIKHNV